MLPDIGSITGTLGAGSASPKSSASVSNASDAIGGMFSSTTGGFFGGDFNVQYGGIGGATSAGGVVRSLPTLLLVGGAVVAFLWLRKRA